VAPLLSLFVAGAALSTDVHPFHEQLELRLAVTAAAAWRQQPQQLSPAFSNSTEFPTGSTALTGTLLTSQSLQSPAAKRARVGDGSSSSSSQAGQTQDPSSTAAAAAGIPAVVQQLLDFCWQQIFDQSCGHTLALRLSLLQYLLVPLLELAPRQQQRAAWFASRVQQLRLLAEHGHAAAAVAAAGDALEEAWRLGSRCAAYR
jgi:hypothetical protein